MALAASSIVSPKRIGLNSAVGLSVQGPLFGIIESGADPYTVLWYNGSRVASVTAASLDEILEADAAVGEGFVGRRVTVNVPVGQTNWGICTCIAAYKRTGANTLLLQTQQGAFLEVFPSSCSAIN